MNGPESFTPDNNFIMGEAPELKNFYVAAGFNSIGIASGGGAGRALAEWIVNGEPTLDLWPVDIRRFARFHDDDRFLKERVSEVLGLHYMMPWPNRELQSARPQRQSPLYEPARGAERAVRLQDGLGAAELLCARQGRRAARLCVGTAELVSLRGRRTQGDARGGDDHGPYLILQVHDGGARRGKRFAAPLRERCCSAARHHGLHRASERAWHLRKRSDDRAAWPPSASCSSPARRKPRAMPTGLPAIRRRAPPHG